MPLVTIKTVTVVKISITSIVGQKRIRLHVTLLPEKMQCLLHEYGGNMHEDGSKCYRFYLE